MAVTPSDITWIKEEVSKIKEKDLKSNYESLLNSLAACKASHATGKRLDFMVERITWVDCRLQGYSLTGMKSWWFRTKARAKYYKLGGLEK